MAEPVKQAKTLAQLAAEPQAVKIERAMVHQALQVPGGGTETTLSPTRVPGIKMMYHPGYGLIVDSKGKLVLIPSANVIVAYE